MFFNIRLLLKKYSATVGSCNIYNIQGEIWVQSLAIAANCPILGQVGFLDPPLMVSRKSSHGEFPLENPPSVS